MEMQAKQVKQEKQAIVDAVAANDLPRTLAEIIRSEAEARGCAADRDFKVAFTASLSKDPNSAPAQSDAARIWLGISVSICYESESQGQSVCHTFEF
jgi:hypothetical protein